MVYSMALFVFIGQLMALSINSETQTSWTGLFNVPGPVFHWEDAYFLSQSAVASNGNLMLGANEYIIDDSFLGVRSIYADDIDLDGDMDVLGAAYGLDELSWWENNGEVNGPWVKYVVDSDFLGARSICTSDLNNDDYPDIIAAGYDAAQVAWWQNPGNQHGVWVKHIIDDQFDEAWFVHAADVNGDGVIDVIGSSINGTIRWWQSTKNDKAGWIKHTICTVLGSIRSVNSCDIDGDGDTDIISASYNASSGGRVHWFENTDGTGSIMEKHLIKHLSGAHSVCPGDIDQDGDQDVVACGQSADRIVWFEHIAGNDIDWVEHIIKVPFDGARSIHAVDMDLDGDLDVAGVASNCDEVGWWENIDAGTSWKEHMLSMGCTGAYSVYTSNFGPDKTPYVIVGDYLRDRVSLFSPYQTSSASLESSILYLGNDPEWGNLDWYPVMSGLSFQIRASDNYTQMGEWSSELTSPASLSGLLQDNDSFFQYRTLFRGGSDPSPYLSEVTVSWNSVGIGDCIAPVEPVTAYLTVSPNPARENASIVFYLSLPSEVSLVVYDILGRVSWSSIYTTTSEVTNSIVLPELLPGIYFCKLTSDLYSLNQRFIVIK